MALFAKYPTHSPSSSSEVSLLKSHIYLTLTFTSFTGYKPMFCPVWGWIELEFPTHGSMAFPNGSIHGIPQWFHSWQAQDPGHRSCDPHLCGAVQKTGSFSKTWPLPMADAFFLIGMLICFWEVRQTQFGKVCT